MKMSKKMLSIILAIMMIITIVPITASAASPTLTLMANDTDVTVGEIITIDVSVSENSQLSVLTADLIYDSTVFEAVSIRSYGIFNDNGKIHEAVNCKLSNGKARFTGVVAGIIVEGGLLFSVELKVIKSSDCNISIDVVESCDGDLNNLSISSNTVKIKGSSIKKGDVNGDGKITAVDARIVLQFVAGLRTLTEEETVQADISRDNVVSVIDARAILQVVAGLLESSNDIEIIPTTSTIKAPNIVLSSNFKYANIGDVITVTVTLPKNSSISGITADICFDSSTYKPLEMKSGDFNATVNYNFDDGKSRFTTANATTFEQEGILCTLKLEVLKTSNTNISLDVVEAIDVDYNLVSIHADDIVFCSEHQYDNWIVVVEPTCCSNGVEKAVCISCGAEQERSIPVTKHTYTWYTISVVTCETDGVMLGECTVCGATDVKATLKTGHNIVDGVCQNCGYTENIGNDDPNTDDNENTGNEDNNDDNNEDVTDPSENCSCNCHKSGISNFFFKIGLFFQKIFGSNKYCGCGVAHY